MWNSSSTSSFMVSPNVGDDHSPLLASISQLARFYKEKPFIRETLGFSKINPPIFSWIHKHNTFTNMFGFMKSPFKSTTSSPDDSNPESYGTTTRRTSSEPALIMFDMMNEAEKPSPYTSNTSKASKNDFGDSGGFDNQSVQELEHYAVYKAEETTKTVSNCLAIAEDIREDASKTLETLHQQGEQIYRTHQMAINLDRDLSKGEKILGSLGGMFSRTWKPKKAREIKGPKITPEKSSKPPTKEQKEKLGTTPIPKMQKAHKPNSDEPANCYQKIEAEKAKHDDGLDDLSNILGDLKGMALDMGTELNKQIKALDHVNDDIDELNSRVKDADKRVRKLVSK